MTTEGPDPNQDTPASEPGTPAGPPPGPGEVRAPGTTEHPVPSEHTAPSEYPPASPQPGPDEHASPSPYTGPGEHPAPGSSPHAGPNEHPAPSHHTGSGPGMGSGEGRGPGEHTGPGWGPGPGPGSGRPPGTVPSAQPQSRGCAVVGVIAAVLVVVLLVGGAIWFVVSRDVLEPGDYEAAPECSAGETDALDELVPGHEPEVQEPLGGAQETFGSGHQCRWATPGGEGNAVPATATLVTVVAPDPGGVDTAADNLRSSAGREREPLDGLGDEAFTWVRSGAFTAGCAGVRVSNLYVETCHSAAADYDATRSIDGEQAVAGAVRLAEDVVAGLPD